MPCSLFVRVNDQHKSYFGHWAHLILVIYCYVSLFFLINVIFVNTVKVMVSGNSAKQ